jgi:hypothetical protein
MMDFNGGCPKGSDAIADLSAERSSKRRARSARRNSYELTQAGLKVVGLERGAPRFTVPDFQSPAIHDDLRFWIRKAMMQDSTKVAITFRNNSDQTALPIRRWNATQSLMNAIPQACTDRGKVHDG